MNRERTFSVFIAEDRVRARYQMVNYVLNQPNLRLCGIAKNGDEAFAKLSANTYDLILMNVHMPRMSGFDVISRLKETPSVIFTSRRKNSAILALDMGALDYLRKPFTQERFQQSIDRFITKQGDFRNPERAVPVSPLTHNLSFKNGKNLCLLPHDEIIYLRSHEKRIVIHTNEQGFEASMMLKDAEARLPASRFQRIHKQYIVNIENISLMKYYMGGQYLVHLNDEDETCLPVGRRYAGELKERLRIA